MNIYFACSITGGRQDEERYQAIVSDLLDNGHIVPTAGLAGPDVRVLEGITDPVVVYERDTLWIRECDMLVAEVSTPSHGVGYEIGYALQLNKHVICLYLKGTPVSKMILGNKDPRLMTFSYANINEAIDFIHRKLAEAGNG
jgi:hypothetical protein